MSLSEIFSIERLAEGIARVEFGLPGESQNVVRRDFIDQTEQLLDALEADHTVRGVVFASNKPGSFIAGADIHMLAECETAEQVSELAGYGQAICQRIGQFSKPIVAAIDGICLGAGLEFALACHGRVCSDADETRLGLPEVQLGLLPGSGGTQRLPRLIGVSKALDMMLTGRQVRPRQALRCGLVDGVASRAGLPTLALARLSQLIAKDPGEVVHRVADRVMIKAPLRSFVFDQIRSQTRKKTRSHYPAPERIIDCVETGYSQGIEAGFAAEGKQFGWLSQTPVARELMQLYFSTTERKKAAVKSESITPIERVGVLGAGLMGAGIAYVSSARAEADVCLKDRDGQSLMRGLAWLAQQIGQRQRRGQLSRYEAGQQMGRIRPAVDYDGFHTLDLVIEAVFEDLDLKRTILAEVESHSAEKTIFATNTSSLQVEAIARDAQRPGNVVGMHYFSPVERMPLVEIVAAERTDPQVVQRAAAFGRRQGKTVVIVADCAGFYVNRILAPYINEAVRLFEEGVAIETIDRAMVGFGFPMGPFELLDQVGLDVASKIAPILEAAYGPRMQAPGSAERMIAAGRLGEKSGRGFYHRSRWRSGKRVIDRSVYSLLGVEATQTLNAEAIAERCLLPMLNEAARCLDEQVISDVRDGDIGAIFGIGFPPFLGGPFRHADRLGIEHVVRRLRELDSVHTGRFDPAPILTKMIESGQQFYPSNPH